MELADGCYNGDVEKQIDFAVGVTKILEHVIGAKALNGRMSISKM